MHENSICEMSDSQISGFDMSNISNSISLYPTEQAHKINRNDSDNLKSTSLILSQKINYESAIIKKSANERLALAPNAPVFKPKSEYLATVEENNNFMEAIDHNDDSKNDMKLDNFHNLASNQYNNSSIYNQISQSLWKSSEDKNHESVNSFTNSLCDSTSNATIEQLIQQANLQQQQQAVIANIQQRALMSLQNRRINRNINVPNPHQYLNNIIEQQLCSDMSMAETQRNNLRQFLSQNPAAGRQIVGPKNIQSYETLSRSRNSLPFPRYLLAPNQTNSTNNLLSFKQDQINNMNLVNLDNNILANFLKTAVSQDQIKKLQDSTSSSTSSISMDQMVPSGSHRVYSENQVANLIPQLVGSNVEQFSRKVFVGGLPPDIDEEEINASFRQFGPHVVDWPHKAESRSYFPPKGYCFLLFQEERSVQMLINVCIMEDGKLYWCVSSPTTKDKPVQIRPWNIHDADFVMDNMHPLDLRKTIFVGGVPRPLRAVELAVIIDRLYGGVCYAGIDTDPELKYPKGAGRVAFSNHQSYIAAISARFVQLQHGEIDKRVEVKAYVLDDQLCDECQGIHCGGKFAPFFCANVACLQYYCEHCWATIHTRPGREFHKPLVKEGADRPRSIPYRWC